MAVTVEGSGTQSATVGTEHTLATVTTTKVCVLEVNLANMVDGTTPDEVELRVYDDVLSGDTDQLLWFAQYVGKQGDAAAASGAGEVLVMSAPIPIAFSAQFTLKQTAGPTRNFKWSVRSA